MELNDVILSTLQELDHDKGEATEHSPLQNTTSPVEPTPQTPQSSDTSTNHNEKLFLENMKERIHVLFEGFQSPNNAHIEAKVDLTLNFLEYLLSAIETRLKEIK